MIYEFMRNQLVVHDLPFSHVHGCHCNYLVLYDFYVCAAMLMVQGLRKHLFKPEALHCRH